MTEVLSGCLRVGSFQQGLAEPRAGSGLTTAGLQYCSVGVMHRYRAAAQQ